LPDCQSYAPYLAAELRVRDAEAAEATASATKEQAQVAVNEAVQAYIEGGRVKGSPEHIAWQAAVRANQAAIAAWEQATADLKAKRRAKDQASQDCVGG